MTTPTTPEQVKVKTRSNSPGCLISALWFIFFGWWIGGIATLLAWFLNVTIIGLPLGLYILNRIPFLLLLQPPSSEVVVVSGTGETVVQMRGLRQINFILRTLYFILIGWWLSLIWMIVAYVMCLTIIGLPLGLWMFRMVPSITTLKRY